MRFNDFDLKLHQARQLESIKNPVTQIPLYPNAVNHVINAHGKFYGLRSKYDGNGNLRQPMKATISA